MGRSPGRASLSGTAADRRPDPRGLERAGPHVSRRRRRDLGLFRSVRQRGFHGGAAAVSAGERVRSDLVFRPGAHRGL